MRVMVIVKADKNSEAGVLPTKENKEMFAAMGRFNEELLKDPAAINVDTYGGGWLFEMTGAESDTLSVQDYYNFLESGLGVNVADLAATDQRGPQPGHDASGK